MQCGRETSDKRRPTSTELSTTSVDKETYPLELPRDACVYTSPSSERGVPAPFRGAPCKKTSSGQVTGPQLEARRDCRYTPAPFISQPRAAM